MARNRKGRFQKKNKELIKHLIMAVMVIWAVVSIDVYRMYLDWRGPVVWHISRPAEASTTDYDPCGLDVVVCDSETVEMREAQSEPGAETGDEDRTDTASLIENKIRTAFPEDPSIAVAVAKGESGLDQYAKGWNCRYGNISTSCREEDRAQAWSVDCGIFQINTPGTVCPDHLFDIDINIQHARAKYDARGWQPWVAYNNGQFKNHL